MRVPLNSARWGVVVAAVIVCAVFCAFAASATAAKETIITFTEPEKGAVFHFVDNAPKTKVDKHGNPLRISAGDQLTIWNPLVSGGKRIGHLQAFCFATKPAKRNFTAAAFECTGTWVLPTGTLSGQAVLGKVGAEGAIVGGTGIYANAHGTFISEEGKTTTTTITLVE
jgi:hypothetical protein